MPIETIDFFRGAFYALALGLLGWAAVGEAIYGLIG
jgi:hypothetical protein